VQGSDGRRLSPESLVEDPAYVAMIANANPHWSTLSRSTLSRATSTRFRELQGDARATLSGVTICHVNTDMWTSLENEPFGSLVVSYLDQAWVLRSRVLCCGVVNGTGICHCCLLAAGGRRAWH